MLARCTEWRGSNPAGREWFLLIFFVLDNFLIKNEIFGHKSAQSPISRAQRVKFYKTALKSLQKLEKIVTDLVSPLLA